LNLGLLFFRSFIWLLSIIAVFRHGTLNSPCDRFSLSYFIRSLILNVKMRLCYYRRYLNYTIYLWQWQKLRLCFFHHRVLFRRVSLKIIKCNLASVTHRLIKLILTLYKRLFNHLVFLGFFILLRWKYSIDCHSSFSRVVIECPQ
jgi:hypothetical protein